MRETFATEMREVFRLWRSHFTAEMRVLGLSVSRAQALIALADAGKPIVQNQLAQILSLEEPTVARMLDGMAKQGLLRREKLSSDRRENYVVLNDSTQDLVERIRGVRSAIRERAFGDITVEEMALVRDIMARVRQNLGDGSEAKGAAAKPAEADESDDDMLVGEQVPRI